MTDVTVSRDDLETLLFATGVIKQIEYAIAGQKNDILATQAAPKLAGAHERLNKALNRADAPQVRDPSYDEPLTQAELRLLSRVAKSLDAGDLVQGRDAESRAFQSARLKGMIEAGEVILVTVWGDSQERERGPVRFVARLTERGQEALDAAARLPE